MFLETTRLPHPLTTFISIGAVDLNFEKSSFQTFVCHSDSETALTQRACPTANVRDAIPTETVATTTVSEMRVVQLTQTYRALHLK